MITYGERVLNEGFGVSDWEDIEKEKNYNWIKNNCIIVPIENWYVRDNIETLTKNQHYNIIFVDDEGYYILDNEDIRDFISNQELKKHFMLLNKITGEQL